jgi:hypothetical protein
MTHNTSSSVTGLQPETFRKHLDAVDSKYDADGNEISTTQKGVLTPMKKSRKTKQRNKNMKQVCFLKMIITEANEDSDTPASIANVLVAPTEIYESFVKLEALNYILSSPLLVKSAIFNEEFTKYYNTITSINNLLTYLSNLVKTYTTKLADFHSVTKFKQKYANTILTSDLSLMSRIALIKPHDIASGAITKKSILTKEIILYGWDEEFVRITIDEYMNKDCKDCQKCFDASIINFIKKCANIKPGQTTLESDGLLSMHVLNNGIKFIHFNRKYMLKAIEENNKTIASLRDAIINVCFYVDAITILITHINDYEGKIFSLKDDPSGFF